MMCQAKQCNKMLRLKHWYQCRLYWRTTHTQSRRVAHRFKAERRKINLKVESNKVESCCAPELHELNCCQQTLSGELVKSVLGNGDENAGDGSSSSSSNVALSPSHDFTCFLQCQHIVHFVKLILHGTLIMRGFVRFNVIQCSKPNDLNHCSC